METNISIGQPILEKRSLENSSTTLNTLSQLTRDKFTYYSHVIFFLFSNIAISY